MMLKKGTIFIGLILMPIVGFAQAKVTDLEQYEWKNRLILLFSPTTSNPSYEHQVQFLSDDEAGLNDRDLKVFHLFGNDRSFMNEVSIDKGETDRLMHKYNVDPAGFTFILIGKDGTEKLREKRPVSLIALFDVIDAMPMRQREMQKQNINL